MEKVKNIVNTIVYYKLNTIINADNRWLYLNIQHHEIHKWVQDMTPNLIGVFFQQGNLPKGEKFRIKIETYEKPVIGKLDDPHVYITPLDHGENIGPESNWAKPVNGWPDLPTLYGKIYQDWAGTIKYAGFQVIAVKSITNTRYGWVKLYVSPSGNSVTIMGAAYDKSGASIKAGQTTVNQY